MNSVSDYSKHTICYILKIIVMMKRIMATDRRTGKKNIPITKFFLYSLASFCPAFNPPP